jgi:RimJ/RimL family protein N-acetyltransferase
MRLETERLVLRKPQLEDVDDLLELAADEGVMGGIGSEPGGREVALEHVERWIRCWERNDVGPFLVFLDGDPIGRTGLLVFDKRTWEMSTYVDAAGHAETELGWAILSRQWGHGYATEAARAVREWVYAARGIERLISMIAPDNLRSVRVAEKLGARLERRIDAPHGPADVWVHPR